MDHRHATATALPFGAVVVALEPFRPAPPDGTRSATWLPVAGVSLRVAVLLGVPRHLGAQRTSVRYAILVATVSALSPMAIRVHGLLTARPELALTDATSVLAQEVAFVVETNLIDSGTRSGAGNALGYDAFWAVAGVLLGLRIDVYGLGGRERFAWPVRRLCSSFESATE